jgi:signal transduction histidine kinase
MAALVVLTRRAQALAQREVEFVAGVSHELRTPLAVIRSAGENLADGVAAGEVQVKRYGELIRDEGRRLTTLVEQVLAFAKTQSRVDRRPVAVAAVINAAVEAARQELGEASIQWHEETAAELPPVLGDPTALTHCLRNLLVNGAHHGFEGGTVAITAAANPKHVEIRVEDDGPGIDPEDLPHLFDPFYRGRRSREEQTRGFGLGLSLVKRLVEAQDGVITVENRPEGGARFIIRLEAAA